MTPKYFGFMFLVCIVVWAIGRFVFLTNITDPTALWDAQVKLVQGIVTVAAVVIAWAQSKVAIDNLGVARTNAELARNQSLRDQIQQLKDNKPIVFTERKPDGSYEIINVGGALAVNVWLLHQNQAPRSLGLLLPGQSRPFDEASNRQLLIAEGRPYMGRKFTRTLNAIAANGTVVHSFLDPEHRDSLTLEGTLQEYLALEVHLMQRFNQWADAVRAAQPASV